MYNVRWDSVSKYEHLFQKTWGRWLRPPSFSAVKMVELIASLTAEFNLNLTDKYFQLFQVDRLRV